MITMVGEENISVRNRRSAYGTAEEKDDFSRGLEGNCSSSTSANGRIGTEHVMRKMQLLAEAEQLKTAFMKGVDSHFTEFVNGLIAKSALLESSPSNFPTACQEKDSFKSKGSRAPPEHGKVFVIRKSLLDELFEVDHIQTIYHMFIAILILFILSTLVIDFIDEGRLVLEFDLLVFAFGSFSVVVPTWLYMFLSTLIVPYGLFLLWAKGYHTSSHKIIRSSFFGILFIIFQTIWLGFVPTYITLNYELPPASSFIVILEQFQRRITVFPNLAAGAPDDESPLFRQGKRSPSYLLPHSEVKLSSVSPVFSIFIFPLRSYPYLQRQLSQVLGSVFYAYYIFVRLCIPIYRNYSRESLNLRGLVLCIFSSILPGALILLLFFFFFLHCWLNAFAEMLRFGDRMFYQDWWNSTSFANFYRTWNIVVHDWLYYYAYRDFLWFFGKKFKAAAMLLVFTISAVVHEYALSVCFGYFYPVLFCIFMGFGIVFNFVLHDGRKGPVWNVIMWTLLFLGHAILLFLYSQEWYAHQYCPLKNPTFLDYVKPRSWSCQIKI